MVWHRKALQCMTSTGAKMVKSGFCIFNYFLYSMIISKTSNTLNNVVTICRIFDQTITWTNADISITPWGIIFSIILIKTRVFYHENALGSAVSKMSVILFRPQCSNGLVSIRCICEECPIVIHSMMSHGCHGVRIYTGSEGTCKIFPPPPPPQYQYVGPHIFKWAPIYSN